MGEDAYKRARTLVDVGCDVLVVDIKLPDHYRPDGIPGPQNTIGIRLVLYANDPCVAAPPEKLRPAGASRMTSGD